MVREEKEGFNPRRLVVPIDSGLLMDDPYPSLE
jgi:hypothetical protein